MSAYIISKSEVQFIVRGARALFPRKFWDGGITPEFIGQMLWDENKRSIEHRYPDTAEAGNKYPCKVSDEEEGFIYTHEENDRERALFFSGTFDRHGAEARKGREALMLLHRACGHYEYNACETPDYEETPSAGFINSLRKSVALALVVDPGEVRDLPGYWDLEDIIK